MMNSYHGYIRYLVVVATRIYSNPTIWQVGTEMNGDGMLLLPCTAVCKLELFFSGDFASWKLFLQNLQTL